jgi:hypothetical protein
VPLRAIRRSVFHAIAVSLAVSSAIGTADASDATDNSNPYSINRNLAFRVIYPAFLFFRVGSLGTGNIDTITFTVNVANVGDSSPVPGAGGTTTGGTGANQNQMAVELKANVGSVTITESNDGGGGGLVNATGDSIGFAKFTTTAALGTGAGGITPPALSNAGGTTSALPATSGVRNVRTDTWSYTYFNNSLESLGTYGGVGRGQVTYTASTP